MKVNCHNEWDPLEELIVGIADNARFPKNDLGMNVNDAFEQGLLPNTNIEHPDIPQKIIEETREDLETFVTELEKLNIVVKRPDPIDTTKSIKTPYWESDSFFNYCPRDTMLVVGDMIIESPNVFRSRYHETSFYKKIFVEYLVEGAKWISAPKPRLRDEDYITAPGHGTILKEDEPIFDAANVIKAGRDIFYLVSNTGNELGATWLQNILGPEYRVHPLRNLYTGTHIDTTITFLKPGLFLANPARINDDKMPEILKQWEVIYPHEMVEVNYSNIAPRASSWLGLNLLMLGPDLAAVDVHQKPLIKILEKHKIDVLPIKLRHGRTLQGGFHCVTLDTRRTGTLENYFDLC